MSRNDRIRLFFGKFLTFKNMVGNAHPTYENAMKKLNFLVSLSLLFGVNYLPSQRVNAQTFNYLQDKNVMSQINSVSQLRDVSPRDWAFEALRGLVENYGCIVGYPDRTFRGNRALSRYEFAAGLNSCLNSIERLIQEGAIVAKEDIEKLKALVKEYELVT